MTQGGVVRRVEGMMGRGLRAAYLRAGMPSDPEPYLRPGSIHLGIYVGEALAGVVSGMREDEAGQAGSDMTGLSNAGSGNTGSGNTGSGIWRLRGMVVHPAWRDRGFGAALIERLIDEVTALDAHLVWCNGRETAVPFYRRHGFAIIGTRFEVSEVGPHFRMHRPVVRTAEAGGFPGFPLPMSPSSPTGGA